MIKFRNLAIAGIAAMLFTLTPLPTSAAEVLFGINGAREDNAPSSLYTTDTGTGVATLVGPTGFTHMASIDFHPMTGVLYGVQNDLPRTLITIDTATGTSTVMTTLSSNPIPDMSFASDGTLYIWRVGRNSLGTLNLITGALTDIGSNVTTPNSRIGLDIDSTDTIYFKAGDGKIYTVNSSTGAIAFVVDIGASNFDNILAFDGADTLYLVDRSGQEGGTNSDLYTVDLTDSSTTFIGTKGVQGLSALAFRPDPIFRCGKRRLVSMRSETRHCLQYKTALC